LASQLTPARTHKVQVVFISGGHGLPGPRCGHHANRLREAKEIGMGGPKPSELLMEMTSQIMLLCGACSVLGNRDMRPFVEKSKLHTNLRTNG
jgi:hypothetical protein